MPDIYDQIEETLAKRLPREEDKQLLRVLLDKQREGGKEAARKFIDALVQETAGEVE